MDALQLITILVMSGVRKEIIKMTGKEYVELAMRTLRTDIAYLKRVYPDKLITHRGRYTGGLEWVE